MNRKKRTGNIVFTVLVIVILTLLLASVLSGKGDEPVNPLEQVEVTYSDMYALEGDELSLSKEAFDSLKESQEKAQEKKEKSKKKKEDDTGTEEGEKAQEGKNKGSDKRKPSQEEKSSYSDPAHKKTADETEKKDEEPTELVYFTTSIRDGEIVTAYEYEFTVTHLQETLDVDKVTVSVNQDQASDYSGKVFLKEGDNTITVSVLYSDSYGK